jgi:hypothetical protein
MGFWETDLIVSLVLGGVVSGFVDSEILPIAAPAPKSFRVN